MKVTSKNINLLLIALIIVLVLMLIKQCNGKSSLQQSYNKIKDTIQAVIENDKAVREHVEKLKQDSVDAQLALAEVVSDRDVLQAALFEESNKSAALENRLQKAKADKDTVTIVRIADTLGFENASLRSRIIALVDQNKKVDSAYKIRLKASDSLASHWEKAYTNCLRAAEFVSGELPKIKPRGQLSAFGAGGVTGPLLAIGGGIQYQFKSGVYVIASGYATNHGALGIVGFGVSINFK